MVTSTLVTPSILHSLVNRRLSMFPTPTVTGEDPNRLSVVFDEIVVKERILVEGGKSKQILSQFDGPVTFLGDVRFAQTLILNGVPDSLRTNGKVYIKAEGDTNACDGQGAQPAALRVEGGAAIEVAT